MRLVATPFLVLPQVLAVLVKHPRLLALPSLTVAEVAVAHGAPLVEPVVLEVAEPASLVDHLLAQQIQALMALEAAVAVPAIPTLTGKTAALVVVAASLFATHRLTVL